MTGRQQGWGIGSALLAALLAEARRRGHTEISLTVRADNPQARRLYQSYGFEQVDAEDDFFGTGVAGLEMRLDLTAPDSSGAARRALRFRAPRPLGYNLTDAMRRAREHLGWTLAVAGRPGLVPPPTHDVHFPVQSPQSALAEWRRGVKATKELAAAARGAPALARRAGGRAGSRA